MAHYLDKDGLLRFFQGLKNVFAAKNHSHTTVNGHTVNADVPSGAKFTDTVYTHPSYTSKSSGLYKVTVDSTGHVSAATAVAKSDITGLGIPAQDTTYSAASQSAAGLMSAADKKKLDGIAAGAQVNTVTGVKGNSESSYRTGNVNLTAANIGAAAASHRHSTQDLDRPDYLRGVNDNTLDAKISIVRANRLAFLPADQVIVEQTTDGGTTWTDAGVNDTTKRAVFSDIGGTILIPRLNGRRNVKCGIRITFTAMKYNVPSGTAETAKYNYWSSTYVTAQERYVTLKELFFNIGSINDSIGVKLERASGANPNNWAVAYDNTDGYLIGWSGFNYIRFGQNTFGGGTNQTGQYWNYRLTFMTRGPNGAADVDSATTWDSQSQAIYMIRGYGDSVWGAPNQFMRQDHLYNFDVNQNATFPAQVTATSFSGSGASITALNGSNISSGTVAAARIASLDASKIGSGTLDAARIPSLDASKIGSGTLAAARLPAASTTAQGAMSADDKKKLDGIAAGANAYTHPSYTAKNSGLYKVTVDSTGHVSGTAAVAKSDITALGIPAQDTTYSSKAAASGGTDVSLVTTGEKYTWNSKTSNTGTVTSVATGVGLTGGSITTSGTIKAKLRSETALTRDSAAATETANRVYPVVPDKSGYLAVNVPWTDTNTQTITGVKGNSESSYRTGNVNLTAANIGAAAATHSHAASDISSGTLAAARLPAMTGATASAAGTQGAVPAPAAGKQSQFLRGNGTWATPSNDKVNVTLATTTKAYLLGTSTTPTTTAKGVTALADTGVYLDTTAGRLTATSFAGNGLLLTNLDAGNLYAGTVPRARLPLASSTQAGAMSAGDKAKLDSIIVTGANSVYLFKFSFAQNTFDSQQSLLYQVEDDDVGFDSTWLPEIIVPPQAGTYSSYASSLKGPIKVTTQADNVLWFQSSYPLLSSLTLWIKLTKTYQSNITEQELSA